MDGKRKTLSAADRVAERLRTEILEGALLPGTALRQDELAARYGWSRIPVREALGTLRAEGLVDYTVHRGAVVSGVSPEDVLEMLEVRIALETHALRLAVPRMIEEELDAAQEILRIYDEASDVDSWSDMNARFHEALCAPCECERLMGLICENHFHFNRFARIAITSAAGKEAPQREHYALLETCRLGDADGAVALLERHVRATQKLLRGRMRTGTFDR